MMTKRPDCHKLQISVPATEAQMLKQLADLASTPDSVMATRAISEWLRMHYRDLIDLYSNH